MPATTKVVNNYRVPLRAGLGALAAELLAGASCSRIALAVAMIWYVLLRGPVELRCLGESASAQEPWSACTTDAWSKIPAESAPTCALSESWPYHQGGACWNMPNMCQAAGTLDATLVRSTSFRAQWPRLNHKATLLRYSRLPRSTGRAVIP